MGDDCLSLELRKLFLAAQMSLRSVKTHRSPKYRIISMFWKRNRKISNGNKREDRGVQKEPRFCHHEIKERSGNV